MLPMQFMSPSDMMQSCILLLPLCSLLRLLDESTLRRAHIESAARALVVCDHSKKYSNLDSLAVPKHSKAIFIRGEFPADLMSTTIRSVNKDKAVLYEALFNEISMSS